MWKFFSFLLVSLAASAQQVHPILTLGANAPSFALPGVDGRIHKLSDYASSPILMVVFTCDHCPIAQMYEQRIQKLYNDYTPKGVAIVAIQGNDPNAIRVDELDSTDVSDTLEEMKIRVKYKHLTYPYLYAGDHQEVTRAYGPQATPHVFIFDQQRHLRYEGRIDNSYRIEQVRTHDARDVLDALLAHKPVPETHTGVFGCSTKWSEKAEQKQEALARLYAEPVTLQTVTPVELAKLRSNPTHQMLLIDFWATWCGSCVAEFSDLQDTLRRYGMRDFSLVTISANQPEEKASVLHFLQKQHATSRNLLFASDDTEAMQKAFDPSWDSAVPYTILLSADGKVLYKQLGSADILQLRRIILANLPSAYIGFNRYWQRN